MIRLPSHVGGRRLVQGVQEGYVAEGVGAEGRQGRGCQGIARLHFHGRRQRIQLRSRELPESIGSNGLRCEGDEAGGYPAGEPSGASGSDVRHGVDAGPLLGTVAQPMAGPVVSICQHPSLLTEP